MDIDIYAEWDGMTDAECVAQMTSNSVADGYIGYLQERGRSELSATRILVPEAFAHGRAAISAALLRERLPEVLAVAEQRERDMYGDHANSAQDDGVLESYRSFVSLYAQKEAETGHPCLIIAFF